MSMRGGAGRARGRGGRPRGSKNKSKTQLVTLPKVYNPIEKANSERQYEYTIYKPEPEIYEELFRVRNEPPVITRTLPKQCPIPNAESSILSRRQIQGTSRYYYNVRIVYEPDEVKSERESTAPREEVAQIEMSQILKYVSRWELERFEQEDYRQQAEAEEIVRRTEAEKIAKRRLAKNAKAHGLGQAAPTVSGLILDNGEISIRTRGRPRGRGRGRGRGGAMGRGGLASAAGQMYDTADIQHPHSEQEVLEPAIIDTSGSEEDEDEINLPPRHPSPNLAVSSFVANSALPLSPVASYRRLSKAVPMPGPRAHKSQLETDDPEEGTRSMSSAAAQLQFERDIYGKQFLSDEEIAESEVEDVEDADRHHAKQPKTENAASSSALPQIPWAQQLSVHATSLLGTHLAETVEYSSNDDAIYEHSLLARRSSPQHRAMKAENVDPIPQDTPGHSSDTEHMNEDGDDEEYVVEKILSHSYEDNQKYYLVSWLGYDSSDWLPEEDLAGAMDLVNEYNARVRKKKGKQAVR
jgi:hypothetical protein